jgi:cytochrome c oxidase subunit I+III
MSFACLFFSYLFLWTTKPDVFPPQGYLTPWIGWPLLAGFLLAASSTMIAFASRSLRNVAGNAADAWPMRIALIAALPLLVAGAGVELYGHWQSGLRPAANSYGAMIYSIGAFQAFMCAVLVVMGLYTLARSFAGKLNAVRRATFDNTMLMWHYTVAQGLAALAIAHLFPTLIGGGA